MSFDNPHNNPNPLQFQIPSFVCASAPTLAPGGGAEVLPVSLLSDNSLAHSWFSNSGFTLTDQYPPHEQPSQDSAQASQTYGQQQQSHHYHQSASAPFDFDSQITLNAQAQARPPPPPCPPCPLPSFPSPRTLTQAELSVFIQPQQALPHFVPPPNFHIPSPLGIYSASGFDLLSILARVANRPNPRVALGPVDMTCSFVVVDVRRFDHPIVYCSPNFCRLTGYSENEVLGRNCRFLQAPNGQVVRGESRRYTDQSAVVHLKKNLGADKECQTSIINYKKGGTAFMNLVTVIPILGGVSGALHEEAEVVYHVGFQVDLTEQPNVILEKLRNGSYLVERSSQPLTQPSSSSSSSASSSSSSFGGGSCCLYDVGGSGHPKDRKLALPSIRISRDLKKLLVDPAFIKSIPISSSTTVCSSQPSSSSSTRVESDSSSLSASGGNNQLLHLILLEASPDFVLVVSLKGKFLYVAPSVRRVLGYEPEELVERSISDYAHVEDVVPLMRELKEGSATGLAAATTMSMVDGSGSGAGADGSCHIPAVAVAAAAAAGVAGVVASADQSQVLHPVGMQMVPRTVDLLFRMRTKTGVYVWIECKGRLHLEPGKGRKAIILTARAKEMPSLDWHHVVQGGLGMPATVFDEVGAGERGLREFQTETWGMMSTGSCGEAVSFAVVGASMGDILGWSPSELIGRQLSQFVVVDSSKALFDEICLLGGEAGGISSPRRAYCKMRHKNGSVVDVLFALYQPNHDPSLVQSIKGVIPAPLIYQLRLVQSFESSQQQQQPSAFLAHPLTANVFEPLDMSRDSSWQYELQQIRFANQRLTDEIATLEGQLKEADDMRLRVVPNVSPQQNTHETPDHYAAQTNQHQHHPSQQVDYVSTSQQHHHHHNHHHHRQQQHYILNSEQTPRLQNPPPPPTALRSLPHYSSLGQGPFPCSPQPQRALPAIPISHEWDHPSFVQHHQMQSHPRLQGSLKRSWDVANYQ